MTMNNTGHQPKQPFDLQAYMQAHGGDISLMLLIATLVTISQWRNWFHPDDMMTRDGKEAHPAAGKLMVKKALADLLFIPTLVIVGLVAIGLGWGQAMAAAFVVFLAFVGSAFILTTIEKAREGVLGVAMQFLTSWIPGGKK